MTLDAAAFCDRLLADVFAAPLRDPEAYRAPTISAEWTETGRYVRERAAAHCDDLSAKDADAVTAIGDATSLWRQLSHCHGASYRIVTAISAVATGLLQQSGRDMILRVCENDPGREILRWRFMSLAIPAGILLSAASADSSASAERVRLLSRSIAPDGDVAELHVHHAAMLSFEDAWALIHHTAVVNPGKLIRHLTGRRSRCPKLHSGACPVDALTGKYRADHVRHMTEWADVVRQGFIARHVLHRHSWHNNTRLDECAPCNVTPWRGVLHHLLHGTIRPYYQTPTLYPWPDYRVALLRESRRKERGAISRDSYTARTEATDERLFLSRAFTHVQCGADAVVDPQFETLLIQYLRIKTAVFGLLVHAPGRQGLEQFLRHFSQIKVYCGDADRHRPQPRHEPGLSIAATEYRVAPDAWFRHRRRHEIEGKGGGDLIRPPEFGWLIHFKREAHDGELPLFGSAVRGLDNDGDQIARAIRSKPTELRELRGLDIAGVEGIQPLWVSADTLRRVRRRSSEVAAREARLRVTPLGLTLHVGEAYSWLTSGIRAVAEPIHWDLLQRGDRLGHAIAVTMDPKQWWERRQDKRIAVTRFDRLLDMAFLAEYTSERSTENESWLASEMRRIVGAVWSDADTGGSDADLVRSVRGLWSILGTRTTRILMRQRWHVFRSTSERWLFQYLWGRSIQRRGQEPISLGTVAPHEVSLLTDARKRVIHELARRQICIESNPTSNLVVAGLDGVAAQDFLHRRPTENSSEGDETLTWTIGTDDPVTFATTLADEYAYAWAGMIMRQNDSCHPAYARALLDEAAATSMRMRFTLPQQSSERSGGDRNHDRSGVGRN